jgi:hypothetical protein
LLPALREARHDAVILADGFSCRTQIEQLGRVQSVHLAQLLDDAGQRDAKWGLPTQRRPRPGPGVAAQRRDTPPPAPEGGHE